MDDGLPPVPTSFAPVEDADSLTLTLRGRRVVAAGGRLPEAVRRGVSWGAAAVGAVVSWAVFGGGSPVGMHFVLPGSVLPTAWTLLLGVVVALVSGAFIFSGLEPREEMQTVRTRWRLTSRGLHAEGDRFVPWHAIFEVCAKDAEIRVLWPEDGLSTPVGDHTLVDARALVARLQAHIDGTRGTAAERRAADAAVRELVERS